MKKAIYVLAAAVLMCAVSSCGAKKGVLRSESAKNMALCDEDLCFESEMKEMNDSVIVSKTDASNSGKEFTDRKLIRTSNIDIQVEKFDGIDNRVNELVKKYNGYIASSTNGEYNCRYEIRIPQENFDEVLTSIGNFGKIISKNVNARDVTEEYYDTQARLETKKILREKYQSYLKQAKDVKELLEVEKQLNNVQYEIDRAEGRMKYLDNQINYSTISISFVLPSNISSSTGFIKPDMKEKFLDFASAILNFFAGLLMFICYLIVFGVPILAIAALLFWLLFGKIGLLRKLFNKLKK